MSLFHIKTRRMHNFIISTVLMIYPSNRFQPSKTSSSGRMTDTFLQQSQQNESPVVINLHLVTHFVDLVVEICLLPEDDSLRAETIRRDIFSIKWRFSNICVNSWLFK